MPAEEVVRGLDAVIITHLHEDHFDETAARLLPRDVPVFCQPEDEASLAEHGLLVRPVDATVDWDGLADLANRRAARDRRDRAASSPR